MTDAKYYMTEKFCRNLSNSVYLQENNGQVLYQPCCWVPVSRIPIKNKIDLLEARHQIITHVRSDTENSCRECLGREKNGFNQSQRISANMLIPENARFGDPYSLTVQIDTTCNAACVTCGPHFSSLWQKQENPSAKLKDYTKQYQDIIASVDFNKLKRIIFLGGEPLLGLHNITLLKQIKNPEDVTVTYTTNGSVFPDDELIEQWKRFKYVNMVFSIDGTDEQFEYIRWPLSWEKVNENIKRFVELSKTVNFKFMINSTINPLNIYYFDKLEKWSSQYPIENVMTSACYGAWGIEATPLKMREHIKDKFGSDHKLVQLLNSYPDESWKLESLLNNAQSIDEKRNLSHRHVFADALKIMHIQ